jgi:hypothetical protein
MLCGILTKLMHSGKYMLVESIDILFVVVFLLPIKSWFIFQKSFKL